MKKTYLYAVQVTVDNEKNNTSPIIERNIMHWLEGAPMQIDSIQELDRMKIYNPKSRTTDEQLSLLDVPMPLITTDIIIERLQALKEIGFAGDFNSIIDEICKRNNLYLSMEQKKQIIKDL